MRSDNIIFVAGLARSFTSLTAGTLYHAGGWVISDEDEKYVGCLKSAQETPKGSFENTRLIKSFYREAKNFIPTSFEKLPKNYYGSAIESKPKSDKFLTRFGQIPKESFPRLQEIAENVFNEHKAPHDKKIIIKHFSLLSFYHDQTWKMWNDTFPNAQWVFPRRPKMDIEQSNKKVWGKTLADNELALTTISRLQEYFNSIGKNYFEIWPGYDLKNPDHPQFKELIKWAGLKWNKQVDEFITPELINFNSNNEDQNLQQLSA